MTGRKFSYFVIFGEMRTGSNFLEENLNQFPDLRGHGELFNPHFIGGANKSEMFGITLESREADPGRLIDLIRTEDPNVLPGFRFFSDHDPRILAKCLADRDCAKIILTRNPLESYVSRKIAAATGQWRLTNLKRLKSASIRFEEKEFSDYLEQAQQFQNRLLLALQTSGQTAFYINYDDILSRDVVNGLARFLGSQHRISSINKKLKKQNPATLQEKVENFGDIQAAMVKIDFMNLGRTPNFEPRRGAGVPQFIACETTPLLFLPIKAGPIMPVRRWMAAHDGVAAGKLLKGFNQKSLRDWREAHTGHQCFTVLRHPLARAYVAYCDYIYANDKPAYSDLRAAVIKRYDVAAPIEGPGQAAYDLTAHKSAFVGFLRFLKANLALQTSVRVDPAWASQSAILQGTAEIALPGHIVHEGDMAQAFELIAKLAGLSSDITIVPEAETAPFPLSQIYDQRIESLCRDIYGRDYQMFGFTDWRPA